MMKKITLLVLCTLAIGSVSFAQGSYVRFNVGYGIPLGAQQVGYESIYEPNNNIDIEKNVSGSFGSGVSIQAAYGLSLKGILGLDFEASYLIGKEYTSKSRSIYTDYSYASDYSSEVNGFSLTPSITFTAPEGKILPYTRFGPVLGLYKVNYKDEFTYTEGSYVYNEVLEEEYRGGISIGFKGSVGAIFNPTGKFQFFSEINFVSMSYTPKEGEITKATEDGQDVLHDWYSDEEINFDFSEEVNYDNNPNEDRVEQKYQMSSISLQIGVRMKLN